MKAVKMLLLTLVVGAVVFVVVIGVLGLNAWWHLMALAWSLVTGKGMNI